MSVRGAYCIVESVCDIWKGKSRCTAVSKKNFFPAYFKCSRGAKCLRRGEKNLHILMHTNRMGSKYRYRQVGILFCKVP